MRTGDDDPVETDARAPDPVRAASPPLLSVTSGDSSSSTLSALRPSALTDTVKPYGTPTPYSDLALLATVSCGH
eukprot:5205043-Prymnesium_polylepis.1